MQLFAEIEKGLLEIAGMFDEVSWEEFINCEYEDLYIYHFGIGTRIRNKLLGRGALLDALKAGGLSQKDDMSMLLIQLLYLYLRAEHKCGWKRPE